MEVDNEGLVVINECLYNKGQYTRGFRELIFKGRQNWSHRTLMEI